MGLRQPLSPPGGGLKIRWTMEDDKVAGLSLILPCYSPPRAGL